MGLGTTPPEHRPVMLHEALDYLNPRPGAVIFDCTLGRGGHAREILSRIAPGGRLIGIDQDITAVEAAGPLQAEYPGALTVIHDSFERIPGILDDLGLDGADGFLFDLGVSSPQLDVPGRGFSYMADGPLDMRMDRRREQTAADLVNYADVDELTRIIAQYGEERWAGRIARFIEQARRRKPLETTGELVEVIKAAIPAGARRGGPHPAKRTFQALRIAVNREIDALEAALHHAAHHLRAGGRLVVISFHSLEDRCVKHVLRDLSAADPGQLHVLTKKPVYPSDDELLENPRARSAKLRAAERPA